MSFVETSFGDRIKSFEDIAIKIQITSPLQERNCNMYDSESNNEKKTTDSYIHTTTRVPEVLCLYTIHRAYGKLKVEYTIYHCYYLLRIFYFILKTDIDTAFLIVPYIVYMLSTFIVMIKSI